MPPQSNTSSSPIPRAPVKMSQPTAAPTRPSTIDTSQDFGPSRFANTSLGTSARPMNPATSPNSSAPINSTPPVRSDDLDILLRHHLLPQSGGFEGFFSRAETQDRSNDPSLAELVQIVLANVYGDAACLSLSLPVRRADHSVWRLDVFLDLGVQPVEGSGPQAEVRPNRPNPLDPHWLIGGVLQVFEHSIWCEHFSHALEVAPVQGRIGAFRRLHVLLR